MTLRIRYLSDLHLEFIPPNKLFPFLKQIPPGEEKEIILLTGDIGNPYRPHYAIFMDWISNNFHQAFVIPGNHEYYQQTHTMEETEAFLHLFFAKYKNICFLNNTIEWFQGYCFIGTTLWSHIQAPQYEISDLTKIPQLSVEKYNERNRLAIEFLENSLREVPPSKKAIILTHHMPSKTLIHSRYLTPMFIPYNQWFYCDLDTLMETHQQKIGAWFYGHTHTPLDTTMYEIPVLCNPIGYPDENTDSNFQKSIDLPCLSPS